MPPTPEHLSQTLTLAVLLPGDLRTQPAARIKYGFFLEALARHAEIVGVRDASLHGLARLWNAALVFHPDTALWKARFYHNLPAFRARSRGAARWAASLQPPPDAVLQVGVLFDAAWRETGRPSFIYSDYTAALSARHKVRTRSPYSPRERRRWLALERRAYERATHVFVRSAMVRVSLVEDYGLAPQKISVVGGGVNLSSLPPVPERAYPPRTLLFIGKEFYRKGGDVLLKAFARLRSAFPDARLLMMTNLPAGARSLPLEGVEVIAPTWERSTVLELYRRADVFVLPSRLETWGDVLLEAMAFGMPCVGVEGDAALEIITPGETGFVVPQAHPEALAAVLARLCADATLAQRMGLAGRRRVEQTFTWAHVAGRMGPVLREKCGLR